MAGAAAGDGTAVGAGAAPGIVGKGLPQLAQNRASEMSTLVPQFGQNMESRVLLLAGHPEGTPKVRPPSEDGQGAVSCCERRVP